MHLYNDYISRPSQLAQSHVFLNEADLSAIHGGLCCRCLCCTHFLAATRQTYHVTHSSQKHVGRRLAYSSFTRGDYKPEWFWVRIVYSLAMTTFVLCNTFLDPARMLLSSEDPSKRDRTVITSQAVRFGICAAALILPPTLLVALLPNKDGSRWKIPLRVLCAVVSLGMLALNCFAWAAGEFFFPLSVQLNTSLI